MIRRLLALLLLSFTGLAAAHEPSQSVLTLRADGARIEGRWDIALVDLEEAVGLDRDGDYSITWSEVERGRAVVLEHAAARLSLAGDGAVCDTRFAQRGLARHGGAAYLALSLSADCAANIAILEVDYGFLFDIDPTHRALVDIEAGGASSAALVSQANSRLSVDVGALSRWDSFGHFVAEGVSHIWAGYDHLVFLGLLLLPAVLGRAAAGRTQSVGWSVVKIVTAFTVAHSVTLGLAAFGLIDLPARLIEAVIAGSIVIAGLINLMPRAPALGAKLAFGFGLMHGLGFANALGGLGASTAGRLASLAGFNLGVELGQLAVVAVALPVLVALGRLEPLRRPMLAASSAAFAMIGAFWLVERVL